MLRIGACSLSFGTYVVRSVCCNNELVNLRLALWGRSVLGRLSAQAITAALPKLRAATAGRGLAIGAYANGFQRTTSEWLAARGAAPSAALKTDGGT